MSGLRVGPMHKGSLLWATSSVLKTRTSRVAWHACLRWQSPKPVGTGSHHMGECLLLWSLDGDGNQRRGLSRTWTSLSPVLRPICIPLLFCQSEVLLEMVSFPHPTPSTFGFKFLVSLAFCVLTYLLSLLICLKPISFYGPKNMLIRPIVFLRSEFGSVNWP